MLLLVPIALLVILVLVAALRADQGRSPTKDIPAQRIIRSQRRR